MRRKSPPRPESGDKSASRDHAAPSEPSAGQPYKVGPGRPPKEHQFKPGQSGNPKGAKRKAPALITDLKQIFERAFNQKVKLGHGERERLITMWDAGMQQLAVQFAKGDRHARRDAFWIAERLGSELLLPATTDEVLAGDRQAILDAYVAQQTQQSVGSALSRILAPPDLLDDDPADEVKRQ